MRRIRSARITSDAFAAPRVALNVIQASTDAVPYLKSIVSAVIVLLEMSEKIKSNREGSEHIVERSARLVQHIWRQTKDFGVVLPVEMKRSVVEIGNLQYIVYIWSTLRPTGLADGVNYTEFIKIPEK
ncbi:hypothetical protein B0H14DRAFT_3424831 [Mycena olivaceomarginata]|nr:hypothetical protein B0H14DRAFT_3424831 [Mycena olivaceomarginata]